MWSYFFAFVWFCMLFHMRMLSYTESAIVRCLMVHLQLLKCDTNCLHKLKFLIVKLLFLNTLLLECISKAEICLSSASTVIVFLSFNLMPFVISHGLKRRYALSCANRSKPDFSLAVVILLMPYGRMLQPQRESQICPVALPQNPASGRVSDLRFTASIETGGSVGLQSFLRHVQNLLSHMIYMVWNKQLIILLRLWTRPL